MKVSPDIPQPTGLLEASLYVDDLDAAEHFYGDVLALEQIQRVANRHVFYKVGGSVLLLFNAAETEKPPGNPRLPVPAHGAQGPGHACFGMARAQIAVMRKHLIDWNVPVDAEFEWPNGILSLYVRDPSGNSIEFAEPSLWD
ncbi:VOC family protein [Ruegeria faecimaris]|uniref:VOC family protein n=1 Tax=Ruegeria faecimaris TaxID=686389 RepID=UPI0024927BDC|nr:VOC family protein [Ruegeria faecimaris]